jgi:hypothetical protein
MVSKTKERTMFRKSPILMNAVLEAPAGGAPAVADPAVPAAQAPAVTTAPAVAAPAPAEPDSLLQRPPAGSPPAAPAQAPAAPAGAPAWISKVPEKFHVKTADGRYDAEATLAKQAESYTHLEKQRGPQAPATPADYKFMPPEAFKDVKLDDALSASFRERAHKAGYSQEQYQMAVEAHLEMMPGIMDAVVKLSAQEARNELQKVWTNTQDYEAGLQDAQRAVNSAPEAIRTEAWERFGRDPVFIQLAAAFGREMREDRTPNPGSAAAASDDSGIRSMMASEAFRNPRHADHARVSKQVQDHFRRVHGDGPSV